MDIAEVRALLTPAGLDLLNSLGPVSSSDEVARTVSRLRGAGHSPDLVSAVVTQARLRERARSKFGDRTQVGATHLATSLVALLQLAGAALIWTLAPEGPDGLLDPRTVTSIVSLAAGALLANVVSVVILIVETTLQRR